MKPWTLFTSIIAHFSLGHLFFNMLFLFFAGSMFEQVFGGKKLLLTYVFGGIMGNLFELTVTFLFPDFSPPHYVVGASGAIMAIFSAIAVYRPQTPIYLFGLIAIPIYVLALFFLAKDLIGLGASDEIAHFAHLGGAFFGFLAVQNIHSQSNMLNRITRLFERKQGTAPRKNARFKTDEVFNAEKIAKQERIDEILDKISKSGYESLSREEKDYLFNQGQK
jgi:membrane associated rhomboid family serine protease